MWWKGGRSTPFSGPVTNYWLKQFVGTGKRITNSFFDRFCRAVVTHSCFPVILKIDGAQTQLQATQSLYTSSYKVPCLLFIINSTEPASSASSTRRPNSTLRFSAL